MTDAIAPQPHVPPETKGRNKTVAIVAAAWHLRSLVRAAVENKRTSVVEASTLAELRTAANFESLDLVILDVDLDPIGAKTMYQKLKRDPALTHVPVILLTDPTGLDALPPEVLIHPDRTLHKHFSPFELLNLVYALTGY